VDAALANPKRQENEEIRAPTMRNRRHGIRKKPTVEESVWQARRTILKSVKKSKEGNVLFEVQEVMNQ
jgi:hypothetical protein